MNPPAAHHIFSHTSCSFCVRYGKNQRCFIANQDEKCGYPFSKLACSRAESYARSLEGVKPEKRVIKRSHPDFVDMQTLRICMQVVGKEDPVVMGLSRQLDQTSQYLNA